MRTKKGAYEGSTITVILIVIALFMVLYVLFIPPEDRERLLNEGTSSSGTPASLKLPIVELLAEAPGVISPSSQFGTKHSMQEVNLFVKTEPKLETLSQNLVIKNGLFSKSAPKLRFRSEDFSDTKTITINFFVSEVTGGELRMKLNGQNVYSDEISSTGAQVINVALGNLKEENDLEFSVSSPGILFWDTNKYNVKDVILKQEFSRVNSKEDRTFTLADSEADSLQSAVLKYTQVCNQRLSKGTADFVIRLNNQRVSTSLISCVNTEQEMDLDKSLLVRGRNTLSVELEDGDFSFKQMAVLVKSSDSSLPTYQFTLPSAEFSKVKSGQKRVKLELFFSNRDSKNARMDINNNEIALDTSETSFSRDVSDLVIEGTNFLRLMPTNTFTITGLKITLQ